MLTPIKNALVEPKTWLALAALGAVSWALVGYHENQLLAQAMFDRQTDLATQLNATGTEFALFRRVLLVLSVGCAVSAGLFWFAKRETPQIAADMDPKEPKYSAKKRRDLQTIRTQEDISVEEFVEANAAQRTASRVATRASKVFQSVHPLKNRP